jgi:hypothetical protein
MGPDMPILNADVFDVQVDKDYYGVVRVKIADSSDGRQLALLHPSHAAELAARITQAAHQAEKLMAEGGPWPQAEASPDRGGPR